MKVIGIREDIDMKNIIIAMAAIAAAFTMTSCNKENLAEPGGNVEGNCIVTASTENALTKTTIRGNDTDGYEVVWSEGDSFKIWDNTFTITGGIGTTSGTFEGRGPSIDKWYTANYPASYNGSNWPVKQLYTEGTITGSPMLANVECNGGEIVGGKVNFKNVGGILRLTVKGTAKVTSITVCTDNIPNITLDCGDGVDLNNTDGTVFHIALPEGTYSGTSIQFITSDNRHSIKKLKADKPLVITRSKITPASIKIDKWSNNSQAPEGAVSGIFTVSAEGKKVFFSKGNLYWDGNSHKFEDRQYNQNISGHKSTFYWSNKEEYSRGSEWNLDVNAPIAFFTNADEVTANLSFTANGQTGLWRTLSKDEWTYLIKRDNGIGEATIGGVKGVMIFPDEYSGQTNGLTSIPEGCVFLPASESPLGHVGLYWSSTPDMEFSIYPSASCLRYEYGAWPPSVVCEAMLEQYFVRLVTDVPDCPTPTFTVTFDANGHGNTPEKLSGVPYHNIIPRPADPVADGYTFLGWCKDEACAEIWNFASDMVTTDITLYARWTNEVIPGKFSIAEGKQVYFSKGSLIATIDATGVPTAWKFAANQYDCLGSGGANQSIGTAAGDIDFFGWSTAATTYGICTSKDDVDYYGDFVDWGNNVGNGKTWRTLSEAEFWYILDKRKMKNMKERYTRDIIYGGIMGAVIYPDDYDGQTLTTDIQYTNETFPEGCVFFPMAGQRNGNAVRVFATIGYYWTSTSVNDIYAEELYIYPKESYPSGKLEFIWASRSNGSSVRLVTDVK